MTFAAHETSNYDGSPAEVVDIIYGNDPSEIVCLTTADYAITLEGNVYTPGFVERDNVTGDGNPYDSEQITIKLARGNSFEPIYLVQDFITAVMILIRELHIEDGDLEPRGIWNGRLTGVSWGKDHMSLGSERLGTYMRNSALGMKYQVGQCVNILYQGLCRLNKEDWRVDGVINTVTGGVQLDIPDAAAYADDHFLGGILTVGGINRYILQHTGSTIVVERNLAALVPSANVSLYPGCNRLKTTCNIKFGNELNYIAHDYMPNHGLFDGGSLN